MKKIFLSLFAVLLLGSTAVVQADTYTVAGNSDALFGEAWKPENTNNDMTLVDGVYQLVKTGVTLGTTTVEFKVCQDHGWTTAYPASNYQLSIAESGVYDVTITFDDGTKEVNATAVKKAEAVVIPTIKLHGDFTGTWADTEEFALADNKETASLTLNITAKGTKSFGVRIGGDGNWTSNGAAITRESPSAEITAGTGNNSLKVDLVGDYVFTWTFATNTLSVVYPEGEVTHTYTVAGEPTTLFGEAWKPENTVNDMTLVSGTTYQWTKEGVTLVAGTVKFKVCEDHGWNPSYPASNYELSIAADGEYDVTITFDSETKEVSATAEKKAEAVVIPTIVISSNISNPDWADTEAFAVAGNNETASLTLTGVAAGNYEFGVKKDGSWTANGTAFTREANSAAVESGSGNCTFKADVAGDYTFTWKYATNTLTITYPEAQEVTYYLYVRNLTSWDKFDVYAYGDNEYFGEWSGKNAADNTTTIDGITYSVYNFNAIEGSTISMHLIFNNEVTDAEDPNYKRHEYQEVTEARDYYFTVTNDAAWEGLAGVKRFRPYIPMEHVYGYQYDDYGTVGTEWPGAELYPNAEGWYEFIVNKGRTVVFNDGTKQTGDLAYTDEDPVADECAVWQGTTTTWENKTYMTTSSDCEAAVALKYERNVTNGNYGTICLPYSAVKVEGAELFSIAGKDAEDGTGIYLEEAKELQKGVPYIFLATADQQTVYYWGGQEFEERTDHLYTANGLVGFIHNGQEYTVTANAANFILYNNGLYYVDSEAKIRSERAYIDWSNVSVATPSPAPRRRIGVYNLPTGMEQVQSDKVQCTKVIENGVLYLMYDGQMYNVQGQIVK